MNTLYEGKQKVVIPDSWIVVQLDTHRYYKQVSGKYHLKSMDYMLIDPDWGLYLVELKDYNDHPLTTKTKENLAYSLQQKNKDSKRLIRGVAAMYYGKWYYRWLWRYEHLHRLLPKEVHLWLLANDMINKGRCVTLHDIRHAG